MAAGRPGRPCRAAGRDLRLGQPRRRPSTDAERGGQARWRWRSASSRPRHDRRGARLAATAGSGSASATPARLGHDRPGLGSASCRLGLGSAAAGPQRPPARARLPRRPRRRASVAARSRSLGRDLRHRGSRPGSKPSVRPSCSAAAVSRRTCRGLRGLARLGFLGGSCLCLGQGGERPRLRLGERRRNGLGFRLRPPGALPPPLLPRPQPAPPLPQPRRPPAPRQQQRQSAASRAASSSAAPRRRVRLRGLARCAASARLDFGGRGSPRQPARPLPPSRPRRRAPPLPRPPRPRPWPHARRASAAGVRRRGRRTIVDVHRCRRHGDVHRRHGHQGVDAGHRRRSIGRRGAAQAATLDRVPAVRAGVLPARQAEVERPVERLERARGGALLLLGASDGHAPRRGSCPGR